MLDAALATEHNSIHIASCASISMIIIICDSAFNRGRAISAHSSVLLWIRNEFRINIVLYASLFALDGCSFFFLVNRVQPCLPFDNQNKQLYSSLPWMKMHAHKFQSFLCVALAMVDVLSAEVTAAESYKSSVE